MSIQELRPSTPPHTKWNAIRSKAVPSNVSRPVSTLFPNTLNTQAATKIKETEKTGTIDKAARLSEKKDILPARLHKAATFAGSTGSSRL